MQVNSGLRNYFKSLPRKDKKIFAARIQGECDLSINELLNRFYGRTPFTKLEKERVSEIIGLPTDELFNVSELTEK